MEDFIGNNAKLIVEWGQFGSGFIVLTALLLIYLLNRKNKYFFPVGFIGYALAVVLLILAVAGTLVFMKVTSVKPRMAHVISGLESLRNKPAPELYFRLLKDDLEKSISDYKGKVILLNFWATWCAPCLKELPDLNRLQDNYEEKGLQVIALSDEDKDRLLKFTDKRQMSVLTAYSKDFNWADIQSERPITFLITQDGIIAEYFTGGYSYDFFEAKIINYLD